MPHSDFILGYGSLLSAYSRQTYSGLNDDAIPVIATGWRRKWTVRYPDEGATYLGVGPSESHSLEAALIPAQVTPELKHRERGYDFIELDPENLRPLGTDRTRLPEARFWIVVNQEHLKAEVHCPIPQTYVDTCLVGCLETGGMNMLQHFIQTTELWDAHWVNDRNRARPIYPRHTPVCPKQIQIIDDALEAENLLSFRIEG